MALPADYHMHSCHSGDSDAPMYEMIEKGIALGLEQMCFTEHMDLDYPYSPPLEPGTFHLDTDSYISDFRKCQILYSDRINLHFGIELGLQPQIADRNSQYIKSYPFEFVIASTHVCNHADPFFPAYYQNRSTETAIREFFACTLENIITFNDYDVYGHLDYIARYLPKNAEPYSAIKYLDQIDEILRRLISAGKGLDINSKALYSGLPEPNPCTDILRRYHELGGEILTFGSDAHSPENIARCFGQLKDIVTSLGFTNYCTFENRIPAFHRL